MEMKKEKLLKCPFIKQEYPSSESDVKLPTALEAKQESKNVIQFVINEMEEESPKLQENLSFEMLPCGICGKSFKNTASLRAHMKRHTDDRMYECEICRKNFKDRNSVRRHVLDVHMGRKPCETTAMSYTCDKCGKVSWNKTKYERHILMHSEARDVECPICSRKFKHKFYLDRHMLVHNTEKSFVCEICKKAFSREYYMKKHLKRHNEKSIKCPYCEKTYRNTFGYSSHLDMFHRGLPMDIKSANDPIACTVCKKIFQDLPSLKDHVIAHPIDKPFECAICGKRYINLRRIRDHIGVAHTGRKKYQRKSKPRAEKEKPKCPICAKQFKAKRCLDNHMVLHDKDRPLFPCKVCGLKVKRLSTLRQHELNHQKNKETSFFKCPGCWKTYIKRRSFNKHMEKHHKELLKKRPEDETLITEIECSETIKTEPDDTYEIRDEVNL